MNNLSKKILVVDDDANYARFYRDDLGGRYVVECCDSAEDILERQNLNSYDLIIFDINIINCRVSVTDRIKSIINKHEVKFVIHSHIYESYQIGGIWKLAVDAIIEKPSSPTLFIKRIEKIFSTNRVISGSSEKKNVLVVDDSDAERHRLNDILKNDYNVITSHSCEDALKILDDKKDIHVITLDIMLGGEVMSGFDMLSRIKDGVRNYPVLCLSSKDIEIFKEKAISLGAAEYLTKPYNITRLKMLIENLSRC
ncbi:MAG: response regulator [Colwellia sp.]|nr:response regulator [Colwellia sp.]